MATTYQLITSGTISGGATSLTLSSIPQTYTDLELRCNLRGNGGGVTETTQLTINSIAYNDVNNGYSLWRTNGTNKLASRENGNTAPAIFQGDSATAGYFGTTLFYFPNYAVANNVRLWTMSSTNEYNFATAWIYNSANCYNGTPAITQLVLSGLSYAFGANSTYYLYGIK